MPEWPPVDVADEFWNTVKYFSLLKYVQFGGQKGTTVARPFRVKLDESARENPRVPEHEASLAEFGVNRVSHHSSPFTRNFAYSFVKISHAGISSWLIQNSMILNSFSNNSSSSLD